MFMPFSTVLPLFCRCSADQALIDPNYRFIDRTPSHDGKVQRAGAGRLA
jgi:hypothetical protein